MKENTTFDCDVKENTTSDCDGKSNVLMCDNNNNNKKQKNNINDEEVKKNITMKKQNKGNKENKKVRHRAVQKFKKLLKDQAETETVDTQGCRDTTDLMKQSDTLDNQTQNLISTKKYDRLKSRIVLLNQTVDKFYGECKNLKEEILRLKMSEMSLENRLELAKRYCENSNERRHDAARQGLDYRQKYLDIEGKFDEYKNRTAIEMKKMLRIYNASSKNGPLEIASLKQRLVQLEMNLKNKDEVLDKMDSIDMKIEYMENVLKEVEIQSQRCVKINERHIEEDELSSMHQNKLKDFLAEQKCLDQDKVNTIKKTHSQSRRIIEFIS